MEAKYKVWVKVWVAKIQKKKKPLKSAASLYSVAEGEGFEPSKPFDLRAFQARSFDHSDTPPQIVVPPNGLGLVRQNGAHTIELSAVLQAIFRLGGESLEYRVAALGFHA